MIDPTLRSEEMQRAYEQAIKMGLPVDLQNLKGDSFGGLKILENRWPYDLAHKQNDMIVADDGDNFMSWWVKVGTLISADRLPYHQILMNIGDTQSQPQVPHAHLLKFKDKREDFEL